MAPWKIPGYTELRRLGGSSLGEVILARHDATRIPVAIKYLRAELAADAGFAVLFRAEAAALAEVNDAHVVRLYEYIESGQGAAIVSELVEGVGLREILARRGCVAPEAALVVLRDSLLGLAAAHRRGLLHRDLKPENVLITGDGGIKVTDFGVAPRGAGAEGALVVPARTLRYAAPEWLDGLPEEPASDVYSATATFYECLTGGPAFGGATEELLSRHRHDAVPLELVPARLRPLVMAGMAKDPLDRAAEALTLVATLDLIVPGPYGRDWVSRGRSQLSEAALSLAALWPSGGPPAVRGLPPRREVSAWWSGSGGHRGRVRLSRRQAAATKAVAALAVAATVAAGGMALATTGTSSPGPSVTVIQTVSLGTSSLLAAAPSPPSPSPPSPSPSLASP